MKPLRLVVFDVDGTLVDSQADITGAMRFAFEGEGLTPPAHDRILSIVGLSLPEAMAQLAPNHGRDGQARLVEGYKASYAARRKEAGAGASSPLYPHVAATLASLQAEPETLLGVATGKSRRGLDALIAAHDLGGQFVTRQCADDHPSKPNPSMLKACLAETGVPARRAVMVGDTSFDMQMARAAGMLAIGVPWGYHPREKLTDAHMILEDIRLLPGLLRQIWEQMA